MVVTEEDVIINQIIKTLDAYEGKKPLVSCQGQGMDGYSALANFVYLVKKLKDIKRGGK